MIAPRISVMVPCYNARSFLAECLDSIIGQNRTDMRIVVSDDCSTDGTQDILREYERKYPNTIVAFYNVKNLGITRNCNQALVACEGEYISLFAGDDVMLPGKFDMQLDFMDSHPDVVMSYHAVEIFDSDTGKTTSITNVSSRLDTSDVGSIIRKLGIAGPMSIVFRRTSLPPGGYDEAISVASDWLFQIQVAATGRVVKLPGVWCRYRKHGVNNGKDLSSYKHEFVQTLEMVRSRFSDRQDILDACRIGFARLKAGDAFRELYVSRHNSRAMLTEAMRQHRRLSYLLAYWATWVPGIESIAGSQKEWLKRYLG